MLPVLFLNQSNLTKSPDDVNENLGSDTSFLLVKLLVCCSLHVYRNL